MAYSEEYAERVRLELLGVPNMDEKKMFGSLGFSVNGHLTVGVGDGSDGHVMMVRVGKENADDYLQEPGAVTTRMGSKVMHGWIDLTPEAVSTDEAMRTWVMRAVEFVQTLPPK